MDARDGLESREHAVPGGAVPDEPEATKSDSYVARRKTLKAAVVGGATVGAVWAAPRVEGLSLVADYAAAASVTGGPFGPAKFTWVSGPGTLDYWAGPPFPAAAAVRTVTVPASPEPGNAGSIDVTFAAGTKADEGGNIPVTLSFAGWDPPYNRLAGGFFNLRTRNGGPFGPYPIALSPSNPVGVTLPAPTFTPLTFTIPQSANDQGGSPSANQQWQDISFSFNFQKSQ